MGWNGGSVVSTARRFLVQILAGAFLCEVDGINCVVKVSLVVKTPYKCEYIKQYMHYIAYIRTRLVYFG